MLSRTISSINFVFKHTEHTSEFFFWSFVRFVSAVLPMVTIYQFSHVIKLIESKTNLQDLFYYLVLIFAVRLVDNFLRIRSTTKLDQVISNLTFDIHRFFLIGFNPESKEDRHASIQAVRNFADATAKTLTLFKQPGIDSLVSILFIPVALFVVDLRSFVIIVVYISIYSLINFYTSQRYKELRDFQDTKTEAYFAKLQESNDIDLEETTYSRHFQRLANWNFTEWLALQNTAFFFYSLFLLYEIYLVVIHSSEISDLVLVMGYVTQTQTFLNSFTDIWYGLGDMYVALKHLAKNQSVSVIALDDLI